MTSQPITDATGEGAAFIEKLATPLSAVKSSELAVRGLRIHARIGVAGSVFLATLDCTRPVPCLQFGHSGSAHVLVYVDECALVALLAAQSFRDLFPYFEDGKIRLQRGLFNVLRLARDPHDLRDNTTLRNALQSAVDSTLR
jgi:hypothetical protein